MRALFTYFSSNELVANDKIIYADMSVPIFMEINSKLDAYTMQGESF